MLKVDANDGPVLASVLHEHSLDDVAGVVDRGAFLHVQLPCFADEQLVMDDLDFRGIGFSYIHE